MASNARLEGKTIVTDFSGEAPPEDLDLGGDLGGGGDELTLEDMATGTEPEFVDLSGSQAGADDASSSLPDGSDEPAPRAADPSTAAPAAPTQTPALAAQQPAAQPGQPASQPEATQPQSATQPMQSFEDLVRERGPELVEQLATTTFKLTDEDAAAINDPEKMASTVSRLMARTFLVTQLGTMQALSKALPQTVASLVDVANRGTEVEQKFFSEYPELKAVPRQQLATLGVALRQVNPTLPADQFFSLLARTAATMQGIALAPVKGKPAPFTPANAGRNGGGARPPAQQQRRVVHTDQLGDINNALRHGD